MLYNIPYEITYLGIESRMDFDCRIETFQFVFMGELYVSAASVQEKIDCDNHTTLYIIFHLTKLTVGYFSAYFIEW